MHETFILDINKPLLLYKLNYTLHSPQTFALVIYINASGNLGGPIFEVTTFSLRFKTAKILLYYRSEASRKACLLQFLPIDVKQEAKQLPPPSRSHR